MNIDIEAASQGAGSGGTGQRGRGGTDGPGEGSPRDGDGGVAGGESGRDSVRADDEGSNRGGPARKDGRRFGIDGVSGFFQIRWDDPETAKLTIRPELINAGGLLSGVATYALVDYCMGSALWPHTSDEERIATITISINYIQTALEGEVVCRTQLDRRNRTNAVMKSEVRHEDGRLMATAIGSYAIFIPRAGSAARRR